MTRQDLKDLRLQKGWSQAELAEKMGYADQSIISYKETGKKAITKRDEIIIEALQK